MKQIIETTEKKGLEKLLGERITVFCCRYTYTGKLIGVSDEDIRLSDGPGFVFETGAFDKKGWDDFQKLPAKDWYVKLESIESFGVLK